MSGFWGYAIIIGIIFVGLTMFMYPDKFKADKVGALKDTGEFIVDKGSDIIDNFGNNTNSTDEEVIIVDTTKTYLGKPTNTFDCRNDDECNSYIEQCNGNCKCDISTGECYVS